MYTYSKLQQNGCNSLCGYNVIVLCHQLEQLTPIVKHKLEVWCQQTAQCTQMSCGDN